MRSLVVVALLSSTAHADFEEKGIRAGGVVFSMTKPDEDMTQQAGSNALISEPGWMAGAWVTWRQTDLFAIQPELALSNKRLEFETCTPMGNSSLCETVAKLSFYYLELPVVFRLDLVPTATKFFLDFGPELAISLGAGATPKGGSFTRDDDVLPLNIGAFAGLGLELPAGPGKIAFDVRYKRWFAPIKEDDGSDINDPLRSIKPSHQVMLTAGYAFP